MKLLVNGDVKELTESSISVLELLKVCNVEMPDMVSVQLNGTFVEKANYGLTVVKDRDEVDFLYFMGGGSCAWLAESGGGAVAPYTPTMGRSTGTCEDDWQSQGRRLRSGTAQHNVTKPIAQPPIPPNLGGKSRLTQSVRKEGGIS